MTINIKFMEAHMKCYLLILISILMLLVGCSRDGPSRSPAAKVINSFSRRGDPVKWGVRERIFLVGMVGIEDTTTGCWYLLTDESVLFEPIFCVREPLELRQGLRLMVYGYVEPDAPQTCAFGPVFYVEETQVIE
jgi:hypothetical protein